MHALVTNPETDRALRDLANAHVHLCKAAGDAVKTDALSGRLYFSASGWLLLSVPNALGQGAFDALDEAGAELPTSGSTGRYNAHITVMRPDEVEQVGGPSKITERGHSYRYSLGPVKEVTPDGQGDLSKVWYIQVDSPDLKELRKTYGLTPLPNNDKYDFHITFAQRKKNVLKANPVSKAAAEKGKHVPTVAVDLDGTLAEYDYWRGEDHFGALRPGALKAMKEFQRKGYRIIVWTTRGNTELVKNWLTENGVHYDYINENPDQPDGSSAKVIADVYIDDRAVSADRAWARVAEDAIARLDKVAAAGPRGPEAEYCPSCDARLERDPHSGNCNSCGDYWPTDREKAAADLLTLAADAPAGRLLELLGAA